MIANAGRIVCITMRPVCVWRKFRLRAARAAPDFPALDASGTGLASYFRVTRIRELETFNPHEI